MCFMLEYHDMVETPLDTSNPEDSRISSFWNQIKLITDQLYGGQTPVDIEKIALELIGIRVRGIDGADIENDLNIFQKKYEKRWDGNEANNYLFSTVIRTITDITTKAVPEKTDQKQKGFWGN